MEIMFSTKVLTKQEHPDGENRPVLERAGRRVAEADLHDVGGHRLDRDARIERQSRLLARGDRHDHRLADRARDRENRGGGNPRERRRHDHAQRRLHARRAERVRALAQPVRDAVQRVLRERRDERQDHDAHDDAGAERIEAGEPGHEVLQERRHELQREVPVDDGRHAREHLEHRPDDAADPRGRVLAQIDRRSAGRPAARRPWRWPTPASVPATSGRTPKCFSEKSGVQTVPNRNSVNRHFAEERQRLEQQNEDDPGGDEDRRGRAEEQGLLDDELDDRARPEPCHRKRFYCESRCSSVTWLWLSVPWYIDPVFPAREPRPNEIVFLICQRDVADLLTSAIPLFR